MNNTGIIITMAYPETIVMVADEWYSPFLRFLGVGKKNYVRAGHAALVLINKSTGELEYHDFGRYITPEPSGRVRGKDTDNELDYPIKAKIVDDEVVNLDEILQFLGTNPKLTHGDGKLIASVCKSIDYEKAREHITKMQEKHFIRYAAFIKDACNCARFVTDSLIAGVTDSKIKSNLIRSKWFTPSTVGNVVIADTEDMVYEVSEYGEVSKFTGSVLSENWRCFLDRLENHVPYFIGTLEPRQNQLNEKHAQWLPGIAAGAWFELYETERISEYRFRRISPHGNLDCDSIFKVDDGTFDIQLPYDFVHYSNCKFFNIKQNGTIYRFDRLVISG